MRLKQLAILTVVLLAAGARSAEGRPPTADGAGAAGAPDTELGRWVVAGGAFSAGGGSYAVEGTFGEAIADDVMRARGGAFELVGGFWSAGSEGDALFADGFEAGDTGAGRSLGRP